MPKLTQDLIATLETRMDRIGEDAAPQWGKMKRDQMFGHLTDVIQYSMGGGPEIPFKGNFKTKYLFAPLILYGIRPIPQNVRAPRPKNGPDHGTRTATAAEVKVALAEFMDMCSGPPRDLPPHPFFGHIGLNGWRRFHVVHCDHHLRQFGV